MVGSRRLASLVEMIGRSRLFPAISRRTVAARHRAAAYEEPVPPVDGDHGHGQIHQLLLAEMAARAFIHLVRHVIATDRRHRLGPGEGRPLALAVEGSLLPDGKRIEPLFGLTVRPGIL